ncbi:MAG: hypothetical protein IPI67_34405 [Myxococcales bacterium]|nr:hypothetical protein [Myxococcales bacterium]
MRSGFGGRGQFAIESVAALVASCCLCSCNETPSSPPPAPVPQRASATARPPGPPPATPSVARSPDPAAVAEMDADAACERLSTGWNASEMVSVFQPSATTLVTVRVLAWQVDLDDRPLKVERALVWLRFVPEGKSLFSMLANLYRHPDAKGAWAKDGVTDVAHTSDQRFEREPTARLRLLQVDVSGWAGEPARDGESTGCGGDGLSGATRGAGASRRGACRPRTRS